MDEERRKHQQQLRDTLRRNLDTLELQRAQHGIDAPVALVNAIVQTQADLHAVEAALTSPVSSDTAAALGPDGQYQATTQELRMVRQLLKDRGAWQDSERLAGQRHRRRFEWFLLGGLLAVQVATIVLLVYIAIQLS